MFSVLLPVDINKVLHLCISFLLLIVTNTLSSFLFAVLVFRSKTQENEDKYYWDLVLNIIDSTLQNSNVLIKSFADSTYKCLVTVKEISCIQTAIS